MFKLQNDQGEVRMGSDVFTFVTGAAATRCFGVRGMAYRSRTDGLVHLLRREFMSKGVCVVFHEDRSISIQLHIIVELGVNLNAVSCSIMNEVSYNVTRYTGVPVRAVDVYIDSISID